MTDSQTEASGPSDLLVIMDATGSMSIFVEALNKSLQEIISISALTGCFERIGVLAYRDYCGGKLTEWSGWCSPSGKVQDPSIVSQEDVLRMAKGIIPDYGGDWPEATKTALAHAYSEMRVEATTLILLYTDAPPHSKNMGGSNYNKEKSALSDNTKYGESDSLFVDWTTAAKTLRTSQKKAVVFSMVQKLGPDTFSPYLYLSTMTGGNLFQIERMESAGISQLTVGLLLTWMRLGKTVTDGKTNLGYITRYKSEEGINVSKREDDNTLLSQFFYSSKSAFVSTPTPVSLTMNIKSDRITLEVLPSLVNVRGPKMGSFAERYKTDDSYKKLALDQLLRIIDSNVSAISLNPIFGSLWRTVCSDRSNEARESLIQAFSLRVDKISDASEKTRMKAWLAESYNFADEINKIIKSVVPADRFPLFFLDPTEDFTSIGHDGDDEESEKRPLNEFTRGELLDIGRSCERKILQRLGMVLTRLSFVKKKEDLPHHIRKIGAKSEVALIPLALVKPEYGCKFWSILLHAVLPGTKLAARPAALLAALSLRMGIVPLRDAADQELVSFCSKWNNLDTPETWNIGCLNLLLDADNDYEQRISCGTTTRQDPDARILKEHDRALFKSLVDYKMLEMNLETTLQAEITWTPDKTKVSLGPFVICKQCKFPRSVTIMSSNGVCGMCYIEGSTCKCMACAKLEDHEERLKKNVGADQDEKSLAYWVECGQKSCRAQYVVYNPDALRVRAKCFYCRHKDARTPALDVGVAPLVQCSRCLSRIIWPEEYRPKDLQLETYECPACLAGSATVVSEDTSARKLSEENGWDWLLRNDQQSIAKPFNGRSVFHTATHCDLANLAKRTEVLPEFDSQLTIRGKPIQDMSTVKTALNDWVKSRRTESGTCSLCFSNARKSDIRSACGRSGCHQLICNGCRKDWYGLNSSGRIINVAALSCPFCRRQPAPKAVSSFGLAHVGNLRSAVEESGSWIYAWCEKCGFAKQYVERVCAAGAPPELKNWRCEPCVPAEATISIPLCPGCGVATKKTAGCDHITCPCGTHWCYACGEAVAPKEIYTHIVSEHGGLEIDYTDDEDSDEE